ncbi:3-phenylpropionate/trans-cinnamate dioxygenase ferredoxin subunit [Lentibacillus halodurans]|uniref:3-phenylpropionate/trans-cinnamate dioxygenase ferredoxin subunit n=1 Tax=Lentibacillus halodurans TaxID=237679 RepID=A0A1I0XMW4_9BACI|nr:Rieske 2Fe-2S domain-containing protein [Lentibacillus halodurans]SFB01313.1 3-phenylpropionate/trans-cinnamate dioxygenase ferredoxin subunit [Lentibacillus halodurans]
MQHTEGSNPVSDNAYIYACSSSELEEGDLIECEAGKDIIVVGRGEGKVYAIDGICTHEHSELVGGELDGNCLTCPLHFACFDIRDGSVLEGPADTPLQVYEAIEADGAVWVRYERGG